MFETERCLIRPWRPDDADELDRAYDLYRRWEVAQWLGATPRALESREQAARMLGSWNAHHDEHPDELLWAVERKADGVVAGTALLMRLPGPDGDRAAAGDGSGAEPVEYEIGWHLHPDCWGQGLATEAGHGIAEHAFGRGLAEVFAVVRPDNAASIAVCHRLGMTALGRTERYYDTPLELFRLDAPTRGD